MADAPKIPRNTLSRKPSTKTPSNTPNKSARSCLSESGCPFASLQNFIDWMNVVDDFKLAGHPNYVPRWGFMILILLYFAVN